ncbi:MAG: DUF732 domain-containing protein [Rhodococcus sp. (in: high G+C Gram-positive bacteria)]
MIRLAQTCALLVLLAGCAGEPEAAPTPTTADTTASAPSAPTTPTDPAAVAADDLFIAGLDSGAIVYADPETMKILGRGICAELQQGQPVIAEVDAVVTGSRGPWDESAAGAIVGTAIGAYCPEFRALLPP